MEDNGKEEMLRTRTMWDALYRFFTIILFQRLYVLKFPTKK